MGPAAAGLADARGRAGIGRILPAAVTGSVPSRGGTVNVAFLGAVITQGGDYPVAWMLLLAVVPAAALSLWHSLGSIATRPPPGLGRRHLFDRCDLVPAVAGRTLAVRPGVVTVAPARAPPAVRRPSDPAAAIRR